MGITVNRKRKVEGQAYTYDEAFGASLQYFRGGELAASVCVNKYAVKDSFGNMFEKSPDCLVYTSP